MKKIYIVIIVALGIVITSQSHAQKIALKSGSLPLLSNISEIGLEFTYENMMVGKYKEAEYIAKKVKEYNEKEPGKGDQWAKDWVSDRESKYQPRFQDGFNNFCMLSGVDLIAVPGSTSKIRMVVNTTFTEPGFNIYMTSKNASINAEVFFYDESNTLIAKITITDSPGSGIFEMDYDTGIRIQEAYANAGRALAAFVLH